MNPLIEERARAQHEALQKNPQMDQQSFRLGFLYGVKVGVTLFAWWKNGMEWVGSGSYTKRGAIQMVEKSLIE